MKANFRLGLSTGDKLAIVTFIVSLTIIVVTVVGYVMNIVDVIKKPEYQSADMSNVICMVGILPTPVTAPVGVVC